MAAWSKPLPNRNSTQIGTSCTNISAFESFPSPARGGGEENKGRRPGMEEKNENDTRRDPGGGAPGEQLRLRAIHRWRRQDRRPERHVEPLFRYRRRWLGGRREARRRRFQPG